MVTYLEMQRVKYIFPAAQKQVGVIAYKQHLNINKTYEFVHRHPVKNTHSTYVYKRKRIKSSLAPGLWHTLDVCFRARRRTWWDAIMDERPYPTYSAVLPC